MRPGLALALAGAAAGLVYGRLVLGMRLSPPLVMIGLGGLTLVLAALALWRVLEPLTETEDRRGPPEHRAPHRIRELEREKQVVLKAIKEIELDFQMKKIAEADYREMVERYRARALRLMGELAAGEDYRALIEHELKGRMAVIRASAAGGVATASAAPAAPPPAVAAASGATDSGQAGACSSCGTHNDADARFCKSCGTSLVGPSSSSAPAAAGPPK
jgi:zinc-ribbon domain